MPFLIISWSSVSNYKISSYRTYYFDKKIILNFCIQLFLFSFFFCATRLPSTIASQILITALSHKSFQVAQTIDEAINALANENRRHQSQVRYSANQGRVPLFYAALRRY